MIPFRVIRSGVLLTGLLAALLTPLPAASAGFTAKLTAEQKADAGLTTLTVGELATLDRLVAADIRAHRTQAPSLSDRYSLRYQDVDFKEAGLDRLTAEQLVKLDQLIAAAIAAAPQTPAMQPRERPRLKDDPILSEKGRLQVHGGMSLTMGWAGGGRNYRETGAWVSYFDPVTGLGLSFSYSHYSGDMLGGYYTNDYSGGLPYVYSGARSTYTPLERLRADPEEFSGDGASLRAPILVGNPYRGFRR